MKTLKYIALLTVAMLLNGCMEKALKDKELPTMRSRIVLYCCLVPDAPVVVEINVSKPYLYNSEGRYDEPPIDYMSSALITLSDVHTGQSVQLVYGKRQSNFADTFMVGYRFKDKFKLDNLFIVPKNEQFDILPGHEYRITAEYEDCQPVSATTVVPTGAFAISNFGIVRTNAQNSDFDDFHTNVEVHNQTDEPGTFWMHTELLYSYENSTVYYDTTIGAWQRFTWSRYMWNQSTQSVYVQAQPDGRATGIMEHSIDSSMTIDSIMVATVWQVNTDFMRYHSSVNSNRSDDFMIFKQSENIYSNIDGGLGILCAYVGKELVLPNPLCEK